MREIKFRAWDKDSKRMSKPFGLAEIHSTHGESIHAGHLYFDRESDFIPLQFTGLKDKNGVEIYEGDIVRIFEYKFSPYNFIVEFCEVNHCWWLSGIPKREDGTSLESFSFSNLNGFHYESAIIGNIYENPDLLKGSNEKN